MGMMVELGSNQFAVESLNLPQSEVILYIFPKIDRSINIRWS